MERVKVEVRIPGQTMSGEHNGLLCTASCATGATSLFLFSHRLAHLSMPRPLAPLLGRNSSSCGELEGSQTIESAKCNL
jgi:hypothetical protein